MDAAALTPAQRESIRRRLTCQRDYLAKLIERMDAIGWSADCPMLVAAS